MRQCSYFFSLLGILGLLGWAVGCGTLNHMQYEVRPVTTFTGRTIALTSDDTNAVKEIVRRSAARLHLEERTEVSMVPGTIIYFFSPDSATPIKLLAWARDGRIIVDFMHAPDELGEDLRYRDEKERLWDALKQKFGAQAAIVPAAKQSTSGAKYRR